MKDTLTINIVRKVEEHTFTGYKWSGVHKIGTSERPVGGEVDSGLGLNRLFEDLVSHCGGELKDAQNECQVTITTEPLRIDSGIGLNEPKFACFLPITDREAMAITKALNELVENPYGLREPVQDGSKSIPAMHGNIS